MRKSTMRHWVVLLLICWVGLAWARPGGGGSFSGGGGGGGDAGIFDIIFLIFDLIDLIIWLVETTIDYPYIMLPIYGAIVVAIVVAKVREGKKEDWSTGSTGKGGSGSTANTNSNSNTKDVATRGKKRPATRSPYEQLRARDPDFSSIVFEDFLYALYAEAHGARAPQRSAELAAYLDAPVRTQLASLHGDATEVAEVVIGAMRVTDLSVTDGGRPSVTVEFETNYTERGPSGARGYWAKETWTLKRSPNARSRAPARARMFGCPGCGAPLDGLKGTTCSHCNQVVDTGEFDWLVTDLSVDAREARGPLLTAEVEEQGTDLPTRFDAARDQALATLSAADPKFDRKAFTARVELIFSQLQVAWSSRDWTRIRPYLTDALFQMQLGFIEAYQRAGLRNVTEQAHVTGVEVVKVTADRYFDAITVRLRATSTDYTVSDDGKLVAGKRDSLRSYSEYWTFVRGVGVKGTANATVESGCPNCGGKLKVNMTGNCEYCSTRIACGEFDWALSRIEQDEVYSG